MHWDNLANPDIIGRARENTGLGASQTAEVAWLEKMGFSYLEKDILDFYLGDPRASDSQAIHDSGEVVRDVLRSLDPADARSSASATSTTAEVLGRTQDESVLTSVLPGSDPEALAIREI